MVPPSLGTWGLSDQRQKHLDCAMPCPPAPAQFMNTPHRAGQLLRSLEPTTFSLKSRGLSKISVGSVSLGIEPGDPLLLGVLPVVKHCVFDRRGLRLRWPCAKLTLIRPGAQS